MIHAEHITKTYGNGDATVMALNDVSLTIPEGEMLAIMGASGSGKTTLLRVLSGLDQDVEGNIYYNDTDILSLSDNSLSEFRLNHIGFVFQSFQLIPELTAEENIILPQKIAKSKPTIDQSLIQRLGLEHLLHHIPETLSGGQKQRVAIARAIINHPAVLFADEPTGALDSKNANEIMNILTNLHVDGKTIVIVTHNAEIASRCERIIHLSDGKILS